MQNSFVEWDNHLIKKYNVSGPRYTSYPTALSFESGFETQQVIDAIKSSDNSELSLYIHIPFCHQLCFYCGCNKIITRHQHKADLYLDYLEQEAQKQAPLYEKYHIQQLHLGGGTPTFLTKAQMSRLMVIIKQNFNFDSNVQAGIEIDPRSLEEGMLVHLKALGFNRVSFGIQDFDDDVQKAVNREQCADNVASLVSEARQLGFESVNADMIYGLPLQTPESFAKSMARLIALSPDRVSVFNYAHLPDRFAAQRKIKDEQLPTPEQKLNMFKNTLAQMNAAGYVNIGMDHFAKNTDSLAVAQQQGRLHRNFQGYTTHGNCDLLGLGASSISQVGDSIFQNPKELKEYYAALENNVIPVVKGLTLTQDDKIRAFVIKEIICHFQLDFSLVERQFGINFRDYFQDELQDMAGFDSDGMISLSETQLRVENKGRLFIRNICMTFDAYLKKQAKLTRFSRVI